MAVLHVLLVCLVGTVLAAPSDVLSTPRDAPGGIVQRVPLLMPDVQPKVADTYLCHPIKMGKTPEYIVGYEPHADMNVAHHMLLYGCTTPGSSEPVWNCGEMAAKGRTAYKTGPVCGSGAKIVYAWAMDAPSLKLPEDVGFKVGGDSGIDYLVLQVHYKTVTAFLPPKNGVDSSGITLSMTETPQSRLAGVYLLGTSGRINPHTVTYMETACPFTENFVIHPFAFRTHAHTLGQVSSGYRIRNGQWTEIGRMSPKKPQMFYNSTTPGLEIQKGDVLAARCTMKNDLEHTVRIGSTQNDEMCNFYVMYYSDHGQSMHDTYCFSSGPPGYYWKDDDSMAGTLDSIPRTASVIPGTNDVIEQTAERSLYPKTQNIVLDDSDIDLNVDPQKLESVELQRLLDYLQNRGPRAYEDDYNY